MKRRRGLISGGKKMSNEEKEVREKKNAIF